MAKTKSSNIPHYELLYIVPNKFTEDELKPIFEKVYKIISDKGGKITFTEEWGKRRLAYPIKHFSYAYYTLVEFDLEGSKVAEIDRALHMMSEVLRHQIITKKVKTEEEIKKEKEITKKIAAKQAEEKKTLEEKERAKDKKKIDLEDLDEKLDKILETDDLL
jgi:small subunit ribosomal protein S6